jgi:hypothetical protein
MLGQGDAVQHADDFVGAEHDGEPPRLLGAGIRSSKD